MDSAGDLQLPLAKAAPTYGWPLTGPAYDKLRAASTAMHLEKKRWFGSWMICVVASAGVLVFTLVVYVVISATSMKRDADGNPDPAVQRAMIFDAVKMLAAPSIMFLIQIALLVATMSNPPDNALSELIHEF